MAGFWTGLVHGTLMCGATLAALSLALPRDAGGGQEGRSASDGATVPAAARSPGPAAGSTPASPIPGTDQGVAPIAPLPSQDEDRVGDPALVPDPNASSRPSIAAAAPGPSLATPTAVDDAPLEEDAAGPAERLPDPVGSDFRRGSDDPPQVPQTAPTPIERHVPRSVAASEEGAPPPVPSSVEAPPVPAAPVLSDLPAPEPFVPEPLVAPAEESPTMVTAPGRVTAPGLDRAPESRSQEAARTAEAEPAAMSRDVSSDTRAPRDPSGAGPQPGDRQPAPQAEEDSPLAGETATGSASFRAPRPAPNLSIPQALFAPAANGRSAPALPQPAGTTPPGPDLSDINPGASR